MAFHHQHRFRGMRSVWICQSLALGPPAWVPDYGDLACPLAEGSIADMVIVYHFLFDFNPLAALSVWIQRSGNTILCLIPHPVCS